MTTSDIKWLLASIAIGVFLAILFVTTRPALALECGPAIWQINNCPAGPAGAADRKSVV